MLSREYLSKIDYSKNRLLIDWFSFSSRIDDFFSIVSLLGMSDCNFECLPGVNGYSERYYFNGISVHVAGNNSTVFTGSARQRSISGVWLEMSGQGCRTFESYGHGDWQTLLDYVSFNNQEITERVKDADGNEKHVKYNAHNITVNRVDLAYDDFLGYLDIHKIAEDTRAHNYVSKFRSDPQIIESIGDVESALTVTHGRMGSDVFIRIYDKRLESHAEDFTDHWIRSEIMLRHDRAAAAIDLLTDQYDYKDGVRYLISSKKEIDEMYFLVMNNYLRFIQPSDTDSNRWRAPLADHWEKFCNSVTSFRISLFTSSGVDYSLLRMDNYVENVLSGVIYTYVTVHGVDKMLDICNSNVYKLSNKYRLLLAEAAEPVPGQINMDEILYYSGGYDV